MKVTNEKRGISLIVLIITIVVIIILAAAVILTIGNNNPVDSAKKAVFINDISSLKDQLSLYIGQQYLDSNGSFSVTSLNRKPLEEIIPEAADKYAGKFIIKNGVIRGNDTLTAQEQEWLKGIVEMNTIETSDILFECQSNLVTRIKGMFEAVGLTAYMTSNTTPTVINIVSDPAKTITSDEQKIIDSIEAGVTVYGVKYNFSIEFHDFMKIYCQNNDITSDQVIAMVTHLEALKSDLQNIPSKYNLTVEQKNEIFTGLAQTKLVINDGSSQIAVLTILQ